VATAKTHAVCAFGARIELDPRSTLGQIDAELQDLQKLIIDMARTAHESNQRPTFTTAPARR